MPRPSALTLMRRALPAALWLGFCYGILAVFGLAVFP